MSLVQVKLYRKYNSHIFPTVFRLANTGHGIYIQPYFAIHVTQTEQIICIAMGRGHFKVKPFQFQIQSTRFITLVVAT